MKRHLIREKEHRVLLRNWDWILGKKGSSFFFGFTPVNQGWCWLKKCWDIVAFNGDD